MTPLLIVLALIAVAGIAGALRSASHDGYRRLPAKGPAATR